MSISINTIAILIISFNLTVIDKCNAKSRPNYKYPILRDTIPGRMQILENYNKKLDKNLEKYYWKATVISSSVFYPNCRSIKQIQDTLTKYNLYLEPPYSGTDSLSIKKFNRTYVRVRIFENGKGELVFPKYLKYGYEDLIRAWISKLNFGKTDCTNYIVIRLELALKSSYIPLPIFIESQPILDIYNNSASLVLMNH